ncbi:hypothetical protein AaE_014219 [Aphanomyces astaci]|uniref:Tc1-like transposase DDE domain-containing protein n=1 Tax=Aphanomyces astaci TaxID=112090 RepID=A0A6A4Z7I3_APHAT|nr:hypothetical protein AaE_014219 [Aphanomyces astaci]
MQRAATRQHAHPNTVYHCLYGYYHLGYSRRVLAHVYNKTERTINNWIKVYEQDGAFHRASSKATRKFTPLQRTWIFNYYQENPLAYLDEAQCAFQREHKVAISKTSVWQMVHDAGLTWKVLERRAMHIKERDISRFIEELSQVDWCHSNVLFLDEVSFDNRGMIRKRGYALRGKTVAVRGDFQRKPRVSVLAFVGIGGVIDYFDTDGTFDRVEFTRCCQDFVHSQSAAIQQYPGRNSVWILDGATIHKHPEIVHYLRSVGIVPIFLPSYCPFFNPIEFLFGYMKRSFQRHYVESSGSDLLPFVVETFRRFKNFDMGRVFERCGWTKQGVFNPVGPLSRQIQRAQHGSEDVNCDELEYVVLDNEE